MDYNLKRYVCVLLLSLLFYPSLEAFERKSSHELKHLTLEVGETHVISSLDTSELYINRKGIVTAHYLEHGKWRLIALKVGTSLIQSEEKSWLINIVKKHRGANTKNRIPEWICTQGLNCHQDEFFISGSAADPFVFMKSKSWCSQQKNCFFAGILSDTAIARLKKYCKISLKIDIEFKIHPSGVIEFFLPCPSGTNSPDKTVRQKINLIANANAFQNFYLFSCKPPSPSHYILSSKVVLINQSNSDILNLDTNDQLSINRNVINNIDSISKKVQLLISQKKAIVIGEPQLSLSDRQKGSISSGGEFPVFIKTGDSIYNQSWKAYGLSLTAKLTSQKKKIITNISFSLSTRGTQSSNNLSSSSINTEIFVEPEKESLVGCVTMKSSQISKQEHSILGNTPLLGPFFQNKQEEDTLSRILLFVTVKRS